MQNHGISVAVNHNPKGAGPSEKGAANTTPPQERSASLVRKAEADATYLRSDNKAKFESAIRGLNLSEKVVFREIYIRQETDGAISQEQAKEIIRKHAKSGYVKNKLNKILDLLAETDILKIDIQPEEAKNKRISTQNTTYALSDRKFEQFKNSKAYFEWILERDFESRPDEQEALRKILEILKKREMPKYEIRTIFYDTAKSANHNRLGVLLGKLVKLGVLKVCEEETKTANWLLRLKEALRPSRSKNKEGASEKEEGAVGKARSADA
jgi:hypothetical protein